MNSPSHPADSTASCQVLALTGFMGSGKTATGQALAALLGWNFVDLDEEIERNERLTVRQLFRERGESAFRAIEHETLRRCLSEVLSPTILALGGGAFVQPNNVKLLLTGRVRTIFLETPLEDMLTRCGVEDEPDPENLRPLAADSAAFRALYEQRLPSYRAAELTEDTSGKPVEMVAREIAERLRLPTIL